MTELRGGQLGPDGRRHETPEWVVEREALWSLQTALSSAAGWLDRPAPERRVAEIHARLIAEEIQQRHFSADPLAALLASYQAAIARQSKVVWWEDDEPGGRLQSP